MATATKTKTKISTKIKPIDDRVVVQPEASEEKTASGIFLPESAKEKPVSGTVIAIGPGKLQDDGNRTPLSVKKGDKVLYGKYAGTEIEIDGVEVKIMRESELLGVVEG
ncbi:MAG: co-chaperone GroES [Phycisphaeraceae bacterium]